MKITLDKNITVYCVADEYEDALISGSICDYYLTLDDLYEVAGITPHVELITKEWVELDSTEIDISYFSVN